MTIVVIVRAIVWRKLCQDSFDRANSFRKSADCERQTRVITALGTFYLFMDRFLATGCAAIWR